MAVSLPAILSTLPTLPPSDLREIDTHLKKLRAKLSLSPSKERLEDDYILDGIHAELRRRGLIGRREVLPPPVFPPAWSRRSAEMRAKLAEYVGSNLPTVEYGAFGIVIGRALADWLERRKQPIPVRPRTLLNNVGNILIALDHSFPGYLASGHMRAVWQTERFGS